VKYRNGVTVKVTLFLLVSPADHHAALIPGPENPGSITPLGSARNGVPYTDRVVGCDTSSFTVSRL
jgi:hypothetical protein